MNDDYDHDGDVVGDGISIEEAEVNIHDIIKARKEGRRLKTEQQRQEDLQRIQDMKSKVGIDPLQRCPKEIWGLIFDELSPEDKASAWQVHPTFRDIMESRRIQDTLFPLLLEVDAFEESVINNGDDLLYQRLRGVSKSIMKSYDRLVEESLNESIKLAEASQYPIIPGIHIIPGVSLHLRAKDQREMLKRLLANFKKDQGNPGKRFFPRSVSIDFSGLEMENEDGEDIQDLYKEYKSNATALLEIIGNQIWHAQFTLGYQQPVVYSTSEMYILFQQWITFMPNVKWLEIDMDNMQVPKREEGGDSSVLQKYAFPTMESLERFSIHSTFEGDEDDGMLNIYHAVLEANKHLKMLDLNEMNDRDVARLPRNLIKSLPLISFRPVDPEDVCNVRLENIRSIFNFNWQLQTINLSLDYSDHGLSSITPVLRFLENFPSLEIVKLKELRGFRFRGDEKFGYLNLPNLKDLELALLEPKIRNEGNVHFFFSLQFLLQCDKLETVKWKMDAVLDTEFQKYLVKHETGNMIDFRAGLRVLYESNIWDVFPSLDAVKANITKLPSASVCEHEYYRGMVSDSRRVSSEEFMKSHRCSASDNALQHCVLQD